jgi:hypothetical protein
MFNQDRLAAVSLTPGVAICASMRAVHEPLAITASATRATIRDTQGWGSGNLQWQRELALPPGKGRSASYIG